MIFLHVYLEEIKSEHKIDVTVRPAEKLVTIIVHHAMPPSILDDYCNILGTSYPSLKEFIDTSGRVISKLQDKADLNSK